MILLDLLDIAGGQCHCLSASSALASCCRTHSAISDAKQTARTKAQTTSVRICRVLLPNSEMRLQDYCTRPRVPTTQTSPASQACTNGARPVCSNPFCTTSGRCLTSAVAEHLRETAACTALVQRRARSSRREQCQQLAHHHYNDYKCRLISTQHCHVKSKPRLNLKLHHLSVSATRVKAWQKTREEPVQRPAQNVCVTASRQQTHRKQIHQQGHVGRHCLSGAQPPAVETSMARPACAQKRVVMPQAQTGSGMLQL